MVIGTGQAGPFPAQRLAAAGQKVAIVERKFFRGTCVNTGGTPTKTMVASAYPAYIARNSGRCRHSRYPARLPLTCVVVKARKDAVSEAHRLGVEKARRQMITARSTRAMHDSSRRQSQPGTRKHVSRPRDRQTFWSNPLCSRLCTNGQFPVWPDEMAGVAVREFFQIVLMLGFGFPEFACRNHLSNDLPRPEA